MSVPRESYRTVDCISTVITKNPTPPLARKAARITVQVVLKQKTGTDRGWIREESKVQAAPCVVDKLTRSREPDS